MIPNILQQSLYHSLVAVGTSINTAISPSLPLSRRVINDIEEHKRKVFNSYVEGMDRGTNTSPVQSLDEQQDKTRTTSKGQKPVVTQADLQEQTLQLESPETEDTSMKQADPTDEQVQNIEENNVPAAEDTSEQRSQVAYKDSQFDEEQQDPDIPEDQTSRASQDDNYQTAINNDEQDDTIQFSNLVTQPFLSRSVRVPITEVGKFYTNVTRLLMSLSATLTCRCLFTNSTDVYLSKYPAQYINCMTSDNEFVAFVNHAIQLALDLTIYPNIWAVLSILLETQDVNGSYVQTIHDYYNLCYNTRM